MTGDKPRKQVLQKQDPVASPVAAEEMIAAKDKTKVQAKKRGRASNVLAGRMMQNRILDFGKQKVGA